MILLASNHQGNKKFKGSGRQCMANSLQFLIESSKSSPALWKKEELDEILDSGDKLYCYISNEDKIYLTLQDLPRHIGGTQISIGKTLKGSVNRQETEDPFYTLNDVFSTLHQQGPQCYLFTMGSCTPYYTCAIFKNCDGYYLFDPHSRSDCGMSTPDGFACMTFHKKEADLAMFIKHLSASLRQSDDFIFEIAEIYLSEQDISDSEFSGFSTLSEGEITIKLYLAQENSNVSTPSVSEVSSVLGSEDSESEISIDLNEVENLDNSEIFLNNFDFDPFDTIESEDSSDNIPLARLCEVPSVVEDESVKDKGRSRKRKRNTETWKRNISKRRRNEGKSYVNRDGRVKKAKEMKPGCGKNCRYKCNEKFNETERSNLFHEYWKLASYEKQQNFLIRNTKRQNKNPKNKQPSRKTFTYGWFFPKLEGDQVKVCKTFFLNTLSISDKMVRSVHLKAGLCGVSNDERGKHDSRPNKTTDLQKEKVRSHIKSIEKVESHYCRKKSNKEYLPSELNIRKLYQLYREHCQIDNSSPVKENIYRDIFNTEFNLSFNKPLKDQCDVCVKFNHSTAVEKEEQRKVYDLHLQNKHQARLHKAYDKQKAKNDHDNDLCVAVFDLQEVLTTPNAFASSLYYKRRLNTYNFTIYEMGTGDAYCYIWHKSIASRGGNEIASCVYSFIKDYSEKGKKNFIFYSDNCTAQNKNRMYVTMLFHAWQHFKLSSITHKYMEKGHTQNEGDSVHAAIECASRDKKPIYSTPEWAATIRMARHKQPYFVKEMSLTDFFDFKELSTSIKNFEINTDGEKLYWNSIKMMKIREQNLFEYKTKYLGQWYSLNLFYKLRLRDIPDLGCMVVSQLRKEYIKISWDKYVDLIKLCRDNIIPSMHHSFYLMLPHEGKPIL